MQDGEDSELEEIRRRKLMQLQRGQDSGFQDEMSARQQAEYDAQKKAVMRKILSPEARERMANLRLARPDVADSVEQQLIMLAQSGRLKEVVSDELLKQILEKVIPQKREIKITRR
jgi:programmed cell death protein 5